MNYGRTMEVRVVDNPGAMRWEIWAGGTLAGFTTYARAHGVITYLHTEVDEAFEGQGLASTLVRTELDAARAAGLRVRPQCPFVRAYIDRHPEYADLVA